MTASVDSAQDHSAQDHSGTGSETLAQRVSTRAVRPGSCQHCMYCHDTIDFQPGGSRMQVCRSLYDGDCLHHIELFHPDCYRSFSDDNELETLTEDE